MFYRDFQVVKCPISLEITLGKVTRMAEEKKRKTSPGEFVTQVRSETGKVVWPTREETVRTAIFVFMLMVILALFFLGVDTVFSTIVAWLLTLA